MIIVTARRRTESLIDVPIAITAYSGEQLENEGALDITDIGDTTPNVTIEASRGTNSTLTAFIRGVGQQDPVGGFEAGVGIYLDDVYLNRPQAALLDIYNVERIEVLRGPQGTLYGRNTIGGAIKYVTRRLPDEPELRVRGTLGTYEQADLVVSGSAPVGSGLVRIGASVARLSRDGFGDNLTTGLDNYNRDIWAGRVSLEVNNDDNLFVRRPGRLYARQQRPARRPPADSGARSGHAGARRRLRYPRRACSIPSRESRAGGVSLYMEVEPWDNWTLRSITAYRRDRSNAPIDFDALPAVDVDVPAIYRNNQTSPGASGPLQQRPFNALVGAYYLDANSDTIFDVRLPGGVTALTFGDVDDRDLRDLRRFHLRFLRHVQRLDRRPLHLGPAHLATSCGRPISAAAAARPSSAATAYCSPPPPTSTAPPISRSSRRAPRSASTRPRITRSTPAIRAASKAAASIRAARPSACRTPTGGLCNAQEIFDFISFDPETVTATSWAIGHRLWDRRVNVSRSPLPCRL